MTICFSSLKTDFMSSTELKTSAWALMTRMAKMTEDLMVVRGGLVSGGGWHD